MKSYADWVKDNNPGNYVSVDVTGLPTNFVSALPGIVTPQAHVTLMYSKNSHVPLEHIAYVLKRRPIIGTTLPVVGVSVFDSPSKDDGTRDEKVGCIVLNIHSDALNDIHAHLTRLGCKHSYPNFEPHATLIYDCPIEQCNITANEIRKALETTSIMLTCTKMNNEHIKENWAKESS